MEVIYIVQSFSTQEKNGLQRLVADHPLKFKSKDKAIEEAEKLSQSKTFIIVISQCYQDNECKEDNSHIIAQYGSIPIRRISYEN